MRNLDVDYFKNELSRYFYYKEKIARIEDARLVFDTKRGVHSPSFEREILQGSSDPLLKSLRRLDDVEYDEELTRLYVKFTNKLDYIMNFVRSCEEGAVAFKIHCIGESSYAIEAQKMYMGTKTLQRRVNKKIIEYISTNDLQDI